MVTSTDKTILAWTNANLKERGLDVDGGVHCSLAFDADKVDCDVSGLYARTSKHPNGSWPPSAFQKDQPDGWGVILCNLLEVLAEKKGSATQIGKFNKNPRMKIHRYRRAVACTRPAVCRISPITNVLGLECIGWRGTHTQTHTHARTRACAHTHTQGGM